MLPIVQAPHTVLSTPAKDIKIKNPSGADGERRPYDKEIHVLIEDMKQALSNAKDPQGVGLAAPQVGRGLRMFIAKPTLTSPVLIFINPTIEKFGVPKMTKSKKKQGEERLEGCLSLQDIWGDVVRAPSVTLSWLDEHGQRHTKQFTGFLATIVQHEVDHLDGILFPKRVLEQKGKLYKSRKDGKDDEYVFDEIDI